MADDENIRYEKKFVVPFNIEHGVQVVVATHPALFSEIYEERVVNNVYLDTEDLDYYRVHVEGGHARVKVRLRWYGIGQDIIEPSLELKVKKGEVGYKKLYPMEAVQLKKVCGDIQFEFERNDLDIVDGVDLKMLKPVIFNSYKRSYWLSGDGYLRLTVDHDLRGVDLLDDASDCDAGGEYEGEGVIVELKYDREHYELAQRAGQYLPWRQVRNSKYVMGVEQFVAK